MSNAVVPFDEDDPDEIPFAVTVTDSSQSTAHNRRRIPTLAHPAGLPVSKPPAGPSSSVVPAASKPTAGGNSSKHNSPRGLQRAGSFGNNNTVYITSGENIVAGVTSNANSEAECIMMWSTLLERYGGFDEPSARHIATLFSEHDFPIPTPELDGVLRHDDLERVGVQTLGERLRILVAIKRAPPAPRGIDTNVRASTASTRSSHSARVAAFNANCNNVHVHHIKPTNLTFEWIELVGKDLPVNGESVKYVMEVRRVQQTFLNNAEALAMKDDEYYQQQTMSSRRPGSSNFRGRRGSVAANFHTSDVAADTTTVSEGLDVRMPDIDPFDIFNSAQPLPAFYWNAKCTQFMSFVLRVPALGQKLTDAHSDGEASDDFITLTRLTNRWIVVIDSRINLLFTAHRVDSVFLAKLRDKKTTHFDNTMSLRQMILNIFIAFLGEFEMALDECADLLDSSETSILNQRRGRDLIVQLVQLQRKCSVYQRLIDLNQVIIRHVGTTYGCRDMSETETGFHELRERCVQLDARTTSLLDLVLALSGHRATEVMSVLTKLSMCLSPCSLIASIYGMNFKVMPELDYEYSYYIILVVMTVVVAAMLVWMRIIGV